MSRWQWLSPREREVLQTYVDVGHGPDAADILGMRHQTLKNYLQQIRRKVEARNTAQAVYILMRDRGSIR